MAFIVGVFGSSDGGDTCLDTEVGQKLTTTLSKGEKSFSCHFSNIME